MLRKELIEKSPIRVLEKSIHGGLGTGNLGVFTARKGVGKTACLVHFATDRLLKGDKVLHISFADDPQHIESWYKQVYNEVARTYKLENAFEIFDETLPLRLLYHFKQKDVKFDTIKKKIEKFTESMAFKPSFIIVDGLPIEEIKNGDFEHWQEFAQEFESEIWFSATLHRHKLDSDENGIPAPINKFANYFAVIIMLNPEQNYIDFNLLKDHDSDNLEKLRLKLDPRTLLISNRRV
jgi:hypothetical protein